MGPVPYSLETVAILRDCHLPVGAAFVRCRAPSLAAIHAAAQEIGEPGVHLAWHPDCGDYLKVDRGTRAFAFICRMKS